MTVAVDHEAGERVVHVRLAFGERNLFTPETTDTLREAVESVDPDASVLTVAADGTGEGLSAGMDVRTAREFSPAEGRAMLESLYETFQAVRNFDGVTVCGCGAYALGAGFELALSCDFRVATRGAVLGLPEVNVGIPTLIQGGLLVRHVGLQRTKELCYLGEPISGADAAGMGLVNRAVSPEEHDDEIAGLVDDLAGKSPAVLRLQSDVFEGWRERSLEGGMRESVDVAERAFDTRDLHEAMDAFVEKRDPEYEGR